MELVSEPIVTIEIGAGRSSYWADFWRHRELLYFLAWRDLLARYKQTVLGSAWNVMRPLLTMLVFTFVMRVARFPTAGAPAAIFVWSALLPWQFFSSALNDTSSSVVTNAHIVSKIYFPRLLIPMSSLVVSIFDFIVSFGLLGVLAVILKFVPSEHIWALPLFIVILCALTLGTGVFFAALTVKYRDLRQIIPVIIQLGFYVSPVFYPVEVIGRVMPHYLIPFYSLNPMVGIIEGFRWSIIGRAAHLDSVALCASIFESIMLLWLGVRYFRKPR